jgi:type VI secretion system VasI family protein
MLRSYDERSVMRILVACLAGIFAASLTVSAAAQSKWIVQEGRSTHDNSRAVSLKLLPDRGTAGLTALCIEGTTRVTIVALERLPLPPNTATLVVSYRIDANARQLRHFTVGGNGDSFTIDGNPAKEMLKELLGGERLYLGFEPPAGPIEAAELTITGLDAAIRPFREACNW